jgi:nucleoid DNA-binding protein
LKKIEEHIYELLFTQDCVIIPNFGGFVGQYNGSKFDKKQNIYSPPSKYANFNKHLKNDDGLLTHDIANHQNISYNEAGETIKQYVLTLKSELETVKRVEIAKVGTLYLDKNNLLKFISSETNFSTQHYGLPIVKPLPKVKKEIKEEIDQETEVKPLIEIKETPIIPISLEKRQRKSNYWWAAAVIIPIIFYSAWIPLKTDLITNSKQFHYSDLNPFTFQKLRSYQLRTIAPVSFDQLNFENDYPVNLVQKVNLDDSTFLWVDNRLAVPSAERETTFVEVKDFNLDTEIKLSKTYHLIGGCFGDKENADNLVLELKELGYDSKIIDKNKGLYRVSVSEYSKRKSAKKAKEILKSDQQISTWVLKQ